jgi:hypothetical protein
MGEAQKTAVQQQSNMRRTEIIEALDASKLLRIEKTADTALIEEKKKPKITKDAAKRVAKDAAISFIYWTGTLSLYMIGVVGVNFQQYVAWVGMQAILVPPLGAGFAYLLRHYGESDKKSGKKDSLLSGFRKNESHSLNK